MDHGSQLPTRKWLATQVTALTGLVIAWIVAAGWNQQMSIAAVTLIGQAVAGYLVPNLQTPGGVGIGRDRSEPTDNRPTDDHDRIGGKRVGAPTGVGRS
jgi:hypothetical protein